MIKQKNIVSKKNKNSCFKGKYYYGLGRRKTSIAKARIYTNNENKLFINDKEIINNKEIYTKALKLTNNLNNYSISIIANGGGKNGWIDAINLAVSRALVEHNKNYRQILKKHGLLKRDSREVERKKPGLRKARRAPQWQKR